MLPRAMPIEGLGHETGMGSPAMRQPLECGSKATAFEQPSAPACPRKSKRQLCCRTPKAHAPGQSRCPASCPYCPPSCQLPRELFLEDVFDGEWDDDAAGLLEVAADLGVDEGRRLGFGCGCHGCIIAVGAGESRSKWPLLWHSRPRLCLGAKRQNSQPRAAVPHGRRPTLFAVSAWQARAGPWRDRLSHPRVLTKWRR